MKNIITKVFPILLSLIMIIPANLSAQNSDKENSLLQEGKKLVYKALVIYDKNIMISANEKLNDILKIDSSNSVALYNLIFSEYKLLEMSMERGSELPDSLYHTAINNANKLVAVNKYSSEGKSLLAAVYMMKIATSPMSAVTLSPRINGLLDEAEKINPRNPESYMIRGMMKYNTPEMFGGSYSDAVKNFSKAENLFEAGADSSIANANWGKIEALAWLGRSLAKLNKLDAAKFTYEKALSIEPDFTWVKDSLLPGLEKKIDEK